MVEAHSNLADIYLKTRDYPNAIAEYGKVLELDPADARALYNMGIAYLGHGNTVKAKEALHKVLALRPDDANARSALESIQ
jgi:peptidylprolyl isomerase